jgi:hypothetical protein
LVNQTIFERTACESGIHHKGFFAVFWKNFLMALCPLSFIKSGGNIFGLIAELVGIFN